MMNFLIRDRRTAGAAFLLAACLPAFAQTPPALLGSTFYDWGTLTPKPNKIGSRIEVADGATSTFDRFSMHISTVNPGLSSHPPQQHPQEEVILVKEGSLEVSLNGNKSVAGPGALIFLAAHTRHSLTGVGDQPTTYYVIDVYTDATDRASDSASGHLIPAGKLPSTVFDCDRLPSTPTKNGSHTSIVASPTATFVQFESHLTTLDPGKTNGLLTDPADEVIIIKSGLVEAKLDGVACRLRAGSFYFQAANDPHILTNIGATAATYQVFKFVTDKTPKHSS